MSLKYLFFNKMFKVTFLLFKTLIKFFKENIFLVANIHERNLPIAFLGGLESEMATEGRINTSKIVPMPH